MRKQVILKINMFGLCENAVSMSNTNAIFKNRASLQLVTGTVLRR